jgi:hypothetical protein
MNVAPEAAELRHDCRRFEAASVGEGCRELGAPIECVMALAGLDLDILGGDGRPSWAANVWTAVRWASMPKPAAPCFAVETRR